MLMRTVQASMLLRHCSNNRPVHASTTWFEYCYAWSEYGLRSLYWAANNSKSTSMAHVVQNLTYNNDDEAAEYALDRDVGGFGSL